MSDKLQQEKKRLAEKVEWFAKAMTAELHRPKNLKKGGWSDDHWSDLLKRLDEEVKELRQVIEVCRAFADPQNVLKEACDVANFAMMIADNFFRNQSEADS